MQLQLLRCIHTESIYHTKHYTPYTEVHDSQVEKNKMALTTQRM